MHKKATLWGMRIAIHSFATLCVTMLLGFFTLGFDGARSVARGFADPNFEIDTAQLLLTLGLGACFWALIVIAVTWGRERATRPAKTTLKAARGSILTEFLIILVPFLALTSGLAQLAVLEITTILGHVAAYEGARAAWVWYPETTRPGRSIGVVEVQNRARIQAALVMAPTAPSGFEQDIATDFEASRTRGIMTAYFSPGFATASGSMGVATTGRVANHEGMRYDLAFDVNTFEERAAQKFNFAYQAMALQLIPGGPYPGSAGDPGEPPSGTQVGVRFTYQQSLVFPWFAYVWGSPGTVAGRSGFFVPINREYTLEAQVRMD